MLLKNILKNELAILDKGYNKRESGLLLVKFNQEMGEVAVTV